MLSIYPKDISTPLLHAYLLSSVAPRPIALASTVDVQNRPNLSPFSFFNVFSANPPILIFSPARRVRGNTTKHTLHNAKATREVVINVVNYPIVQQVSLSSTEYPEGVNEFEKSGLTMLKSDIVKPFRVAESPVQMECKVNEIVQLGTEGGAGNLIICEVVKMHISLEVLDKDSTINQERLDLVSRAGGSYYSRAKAGFFEIPKPLSSLGIGVDALPEHIRNSTVLSGNDLGLLGNIDALPKHEELVGIRKTLLETHPELNQLSTPERHKLAKKYLAKGEIGRALGILVG